MLNSRAGDTILIYELRVIYGLISNFITPLTNYLSEVIQSAFIAEDYRICYTKS